MRTLIGGVALIFLTVAVYATAMRRVAGFLALESELSVYLLNKGLFAVLLLGFVLLAGHTQRVALHGRAQVSTLLVYWPMFLILALVVAGASNPVTEPGPILMLLLIALSVGIGEEVLFRGYVVHWASPLGVRGQILASGLAFGGIHLLGLASGMPPAVILAQAYFACALGLIFAYGRLRDGSLLLAILVHAGFDFVAFVASGGIRSTFDDVNQVVTGLLTGGTIALLWAAWLLYRAPRALGEQPG